MEALYHRGPDDVGLHVLELGERRLGLASTRLAIIDLSPAGHMPMSDPETGNWIVYNGETYNFPDLRTELGKRGHVFRSRSDTEVILKAYAEWGSECVERLRGMFAFALWDASRQELFLARDRMGEKPLYYAQPQDGLFLFASEVRALLASGLVEQHLDPLTLRVYLYNGFTVAPHTILAGVSSLLPGHWMRVGLDGRIREIRRYWTLSPFGAGSPEGKEKVLEDLRRELAEATTMRMISDVPLGAFLSGGLDSSLLVALMRRAVGDVRTFSIGFAEQAFDESPYARWVAERFETRHTHILLGLSEFNAWLENGLDAMDQPTYDGLNTYFVARAARENGLTVALSGLGGDELFGGYPYFRLAPEIARLAAAGRYFPSVIRHALHATGSLHGPLKALHIFEDDIPRGMEILAAYQTSQALFPKKMQSNLWADEQAKGIWFGLPQEFVEFLHREGNDADPLARLSRYVLRLFQGERTLRDSDSMSMASSLEVRTVFTDHIFVEKAWHIAGAVRCQGAPHKPFEAELARPLLGEDYPYRHKQGFVFPFQVWLRDSKMQARIHETLTDKRVLDRLGLQKDAVMRILNDASLPWSRLWALYVLARWVDKHQAAL
nr:asparagine synthase, glutamine-hydrolyzing [uncultured Chloroflexota bacterium]